MASIIANTPDGKKLRIAVPEGTDPSKYDGMVHEAVSHYMSSRKPPTAMSQAFQKVGIIPELYQTHPQALNTAFGTNELPEAIMSGFKGQPIQNPSFPQKVGQTIGQYGLPAAGAAIGSALSGGAALPAIVAALPGGAALPAIAAAGLGGGAGEAYRQIASRAMGGAAPQSPTEAAKDIAIQGLGGVAGETLGIGAKAVAKAAAPTLRKAGSQILQGMQKIPRRYADAIMKDPDILFRNETLESAKKFYKETIQGTPGGAVILASKTGKILPPQSDAMSLINTAVRIDFMGEKASVQPGISLRDALAAEQSINMLRQAAKFGNPELRAMARNLNMAKDALDEYLESGFPGFGEARKRYFEANAREAFNHLFAQNKNMTPAFFHQLGQLALASVGSVFKAAVFAPAGAKAAIKTGVLAGRAALPAIEPATRIAVPATLKRFLKKKLQDDSNTGNP